MRVSLCVTGWLTYVRIEQVKRDHLPANGTNHLETRGAGKRQPLTQPASSSMNDLVKFF